MAEKRAAQLVEQRVDEWVDRMDIVSAAEMVEMLEFVRVDV